MKRVIPLLILCASLVFSLSIAELLTAKYYKKTFSVVGWGNDIQPDAELVYSLRPNQDVIWQRYGMEMKFHTNNLGFRSTNDTIVPKPPGVFRILMAGDSFVFGDGLSDGETIPVVIQKKLAETETKDRNIEIINMGVPGYSPDQSYRQLMRSVKLLQPDLIVWNFISWHISGMVNNAGKQYYRSSLYTVENGELKSLDARYNKIYIHNRLVSAAPQGIKNSYLFDLILNRLFYTSLFSGIPKASREARLQWAQKKLGLEIQSLQAYAKENGSDFMFVVLPSLDGLSKETNGEFLEFLNVAKEQTQGQSPVSFVDVNAELLAQENDTQTDNPVVPQRVLGINNESPDILFFDSPNGHPNSRGAYVFAELLSSYIHQDIINRFR